MPRPAVAVTWNVNLDQPDGTPFDPCHLNFTFQVNRTGLRRIRRIIADMRARPDLTVCVTLGRGLWWRNGRIRITGPRYAVRPAADALRAHLDN